MSDDRSEWTPEELVAELRARERGRRGAPATAGRSLGRTKGGAPKATRATGAVARFRQLGEIPSSELAKRAAELQRGIYGVDDRSDTFKITDPRARPLIEASLALVKSDDLRRMGDGRWRLRTTSFKRDYDLCSSETFASQPLGCFCSGVLIAPDIVATAAHCVKKNADLEHVRFVFGFRMMDGDTARTMFSEDDVYRGTKLIARKFTADRADWALVRLDRPVVGRTPVRCRATGKVKNKESVFVIGHPCGLPQKMARGSRILNNQPTSHFVANLDTYGGNSGSPVFNGSSYVLEGLLVRGQTDFVSTGSCNVSMVFPTTGAGGEDVTRTTEWKRAIPQSGNQRLATSTRKRKKSTKAVKVPRTRTAKRTR